MLTTPGNGKKQARESEGFPGLSRNNRPLLSRCRDGTETSSDPRKGVAVSMPNKTETYLYKALDELLSDS